MQIIHDHIGSRGALWGELIQITNSLRRELVHFLGFKIGGNRAFYEASKKVDYPV